MRRGSVVLLLLLPFSFIWVQPASADLGYHCATHIADYFEDPTDSFRLNKRTGATLQEVHTSFFYDSRRTLFLESWVLETYPFVPGYVTRKLYRRVREMSAPHRTKGDLTPKQGALLVRPIIVFARELYRDRKGLDEAMLKDLDVVSEAYFIDSVYVWVEKETDHHVVGTLRVIHAPYLVGPQGQILADGILVKNLYGITGNFREPLEKTENGFRPREMADETRWLAPSKIPEEYMLPIRLRRLGADEGLASEVGVLAVDRSLGNPFRRIVEHELWIHLTREIFRFRELGPDFLKTGMRMHGYAEGASTNVYTKTHGMMPHRDYDLEPGAVVEDGKILSHKKLWTPVVATPERAAEQNQVVLDGAHHLFNVAANASRRRDSFISQRENFDGALLTDFSSILELLSSEDGWESASASGAFVSHFEYLRDHSTLGGHLRRAIPTIEKGLEDLLGNANGKGSRRAGFLVDFLLLKKNANLFDTERLRMSLMTGIIGDDIVNLDENLRHLYQATNPDHIVWPAPSGTLASEWITLKNILKDFLVSEVSVTAGYIDPSPVGRRHAVATMAIYKAREKLTPKLLHEIIAHALQ